MKHILVVADPVESEQLAFEKAIKLAKHSVADIHVVVFCHESLKLIEQDEELGHLDLKKIVIEHAFNHWQNYLDGQQLDVSVTFDVVWEKYIHRWVIDHCEQENYDLVVKTGHRSEAFLHTPTDWQLFRESPVPIYSVIADKHDTKKVLLVALDLRTESKPKQQLNERLIEEAFKLSIQMNLRLHCCYVIEFPTLVRDLDLIDVRARSNKIEKAVRSKAEEAFELYGVDNNHLHIKQGKPWQVINSLAVKLKAECVVVGSVGNKGVRGKLIGNTAEKIIHHTRTDLLVIS